MVARIRSFLCMKQDSIMDHVFDSDTVANSDSVRSENRQARDVCM